MRKYKKLIISLIQFMVKNGYTMKPLPKVIFNNAQQEEDVLSYALFPQVATEFFKYREAQQTKVDETVADTKNGAYPV